jgi:uncharacterized protein (TIGR03435 family)
MNTVRMNWGSVRHWGMRLDRTVKRQAFSTFFRSSAILLISLSVVAVAYAQSIVGTWQGTLPDGEGPRTVLTIADGGNGALRGSINFVDRSADAFPLLSAIYNAPELKVAFGEFSFRGKLSSDGKSIAGTWTQGNQSYPLTLALATPETLWTYSGPSTVPTMSPTADPSFEVATVKPSVPDAKNFGYSWRTRLFQARDNTVADLIRFSYQVRQRQIEGGPSWINELHFEVSGEPDEPGLPSLDQQRLMLRKLLAERFRLGVHIVQKDFPVYALVVDKSPPKINVSAPRVNSHIGISPRELEDGNTAVQFSYITMPEFTDLLMNFIQDRQIVDETGLNGRFDFTVLIPTSTLHGGDDIDKATAFLVGVQPLGFKLVPKREPLEVIVIDHLDKPTAN